MKREDSDRAIKCDPRYGPIFGSCCDIIIYDNCNNNEQGGWTIYGNIAGSYECKSPLKSSLFVNTAGPDQRNNFSLRL